MLNNLQIMGRLVANPELRHTAKETAVASFRIAVDRDFGEKQTDFFDVVAWRKTGEFVSKYFAKGDPILIQGRLQSRDWEDKNGNKRKSIEIICDNVYFCGGKKKENGGAKLEELPDDIGGELPFSLGDDEELPL